MKLFLWVARMGLEDLRQRKGHWCKFLWCQITARKVVGKVFCRWVRESTKNTTAAQLNEPEERSRCWFEVKICDCSRFHEEYSALFRVKTVTHHHGLIARGWWGVGGIDI